MKCPYCGGDLEPGILQSPYPIYWQKKVRPLSPPHIRKRSGDIPLFTNTSLSHGFFHGYNAKAELCLKCSKVIISYK